MFLTALLLNKFNYYINNKIEVLKISKLERKLKKDFKNQITDSWYTFIWFLKDYRNNITRKRVYISKKYNNKLLKTWIWIFPINIWNSEKFDKYFINLIINLIE